MRVNISLRRKFLLFWLGSIVFVITLVGGVYSYLYSTQLADETLNNIGKSFSILNAEIETRKGIMLKNTEVLARRKDVVSTLSMIDTYQDTENYAPLIFNPEKKKLARELAKAAQASNINFLMVHDSKSIPASFYIKDRMNAAHSGYVSFRDGKPVSFTAETGEGSFLERGEVPIVLMEADVHSEHEVPHPIFRESPQGIVMETFAPVRRSTSGLTSKFVGMLHAAYQLDERLIKDMSKQTGLEFAIVLPDGTRLGGLDMPSFTDGFPAVPALAQQESGIPNFQEIASDGYMLGATQLTLLDGQQVYFVFGENKAKHISGVTAFEQAALMVFALVGIVLIPLATTYIRRTFTRPVEDLLTGVQELRKGTYAELPGFTGVDELSLLAQSFNAMSAAIHEREDKLLQSQERFRDFTLSSADWSWESDAQHRITFISDEGMVHGAAGYNIMGIRHADIAPDDVALHPDKWKSHKADLDAHRSFKDFEYSISSREGGVREFSARGKPVFDADGAFKGYRGVASDITEQKQNVITLAYTMDMLERAERLAGIGHWEVKAESGKLYWSDEVYRIYGIEVGAEIDVNLAIDAFHPSDREMVTGCVRRAIEEKKEFDFEAHLYRSDGVLRTVHSVSTVRLKPNGEVESVFGVFHDITEQKNAEKELLEHRDHLEQLVAERTSEVHKKAEELELALESAKKYADMQQQFVSLVSHEFRTPLTIIDGSAQRIMRTKDIITPDQLVQRGDKIRGAVKRMTSLIELTLYTDRIDSGKLEMSIQPCNIKELIEEICEHHRDIAPNHNIRVDLDGIPEHIDADSRLLEHIFTNLLSNAIKYAPDAPLIEVTGTIKGDTTLVSIKDQGRGIAEDDLSHMFERFFRASTANGIKGTGIGLSVCKKFVEMHGGSIDVASVIGEGSTFTVRLPIDQQTS